MGTPEFAVPVLEKLIKNTNVVLVVTQPDKQACRGKKVVFSPIKQVAIANNIEVFQPVRLKDEYDEILKYQPDVIVTCAYGQILPQELLYAPEFNTINVHASLLPRLRGGAPIHHAIINGDNKTGITIMESDIGMDSGDILYQEEVAITEEDTYDTLAGKLSVLGAECLIKTLPQVFDGSIARKKQDISLVTVGYTIKKEEEKIDFNKSAFEVINLIKGLSSHPGAYALLNGERIKIYFAIVGDKSSKPYGTITKVDKDGICVATNDYDIKITDIQMPNKKRMSVKDMLNGYPKDKLINQKFL